MSFFFNVFRNLIAPERTLIREDKAISISEMRQEIHDALKFRERQKSGFSLHGFRENKKVAKVKETVFAKYIQLTLDKLEQSKYLGLLHCGS